MPPVSVPTPGLAARAALTTLVACAALCRASAAELRLGILQDTPEHRTANRAAGADMTLVAVAWNRAEPQPGAFSEAYFGELRNTVKARRLQGYDIVVDLGFQYPPPWVFGLPCSRFVNQYGDVFTSDTVGECVPNAVFSQEIRELQERYLRRVFEALGPEPFAVRLGWTKYGELAFPIHRYGQHGNCYWGYDDFAQGKAPGLPPTLKPCPVPGWQAGQTSADHVQARAFLDWYHGALQDYHDWQIATTRKYTTGPLVMLYPSWGTRPGSNATAIGHDLDGTSPAEVNGEVQRGLDFERLIVGIHDTNVIVCCTWLDSSPQFSLDTESGRVLWSPSHFLSVLAAEHQPPLRAWAENTGGGDLATLALCRDRIQRYGYAGFFWAFEHDLYDGTPPELTDLADFAAQLRGENNR